jgi:hypothetical protein
LLRKTVVARPGRRKRNLRSVDEPVPTVVTRPNLGVAEPIVITVAHRDLEREKNPANRRAKRVEEPLGAITAGGGQFAIVEPMILNRHGDNGGHK